MTSTLPQLPDPRYGHPILYKVDDATHHGYYLGTTANAYFIASTDPTLMSGADGNALEIAIALTNLDSVTFLDAPPEGNYPSKIETKNGYVFADGENIAYRIEKACGIFAPDKITVEFAAMPKTNDVHFFITSVVTSANGNMQRILIINELKRLGIFGITTLNIEWDPYSWHKIS
jgi:hypothetical protein